ncbi:MAG: SGNH/GDSL hydrolase family protein [candidate division KSB1 bacterium]|nr:SGNH/GDSL hydrolase family protein [candidate division KSB1 bacterium]MDZ7366475.1 SGNH/GDSL hydrolase family protein [candidate division KSB1 bacterium]MDZ7404563.1 SGNH/GDSL hydrolase family protein [candidate division KSB1 bacterium]
MRNATRKIKSFLLNSSLALAVLLVVLLILELLLRRYHFWGARVSWSEPDTVIAYRYTPGAEYWFGRENDHPISGRINNFGWRDRNWTLTKAPNTFRVAVLGDSFVEAFQVEQERTFLRLAEVALNHESPQRFELMNFGRSGFTTTEEFLILERDVAKFSPDLVVLFFFPENDLRDVYREFDANPMRPFFVMLPDGELVPDFSFVHSKDFKARNAINGLKQHSALFSLVIERVNLLQQDLAFKKQTVAQEAAKAATALATPVAKRLDGALSLATANPDSNYQKAFALNQAILKKINAKCRQLPAKFLLVCINLAAYHPEREQELRAIDPTFNPFFFDDTLAAFARENDIDFIGLQKFFVEEYQKTGRKLQWTHWNYEGHELVARVLANHLQKYKANFLSSASL